MINIDQVIWSCLDLLTYNVKGLLLFEKLVHTKRHTRIVGRDIHVEKKRRNHLLCRQT